ncbi:hypothetical protein Tco_0987830 [Tanacetum coccineum]
MYEGNKASKTCPEKETKDASSFINVETLKILAVASKIELFSLISSLEKLRTISALGSAMPPIRPARLGKKGSATATKNAKQPKKIRDPALTHHGHGPFILVTYFNSRIALEVECPWYLYNAVNIPPVVGICIDVHALGPVATDCERKQTRCNDEIRILDAFPHRYS